MLKRILFTLLTLLVIYSGVVLVYRLNEPDVVESPASAYMTENALDYATLRDYTLSAGESTLHYYFFCSYENNDCIYMENTVLKDAESETGLDLRNMIEYVDITDLEANLATNRLKQEWDVSSYPAFVACRVRNGMIEISNTLQWNPSSPISKADLIQWLELNSLYDGRS